jgi:hypothetical protein
MRRRGALDDFLEITLSRVTGLLPRLLYLAHLKQADERYEHWGLARAHGRDKAERALKSAHSAIASEVLQTPLQKLSQSPEAAELGAEEQDLARLKPAGMAGTGKAHFKSVLVALAELARSKKAVKTTRRGA